MMSESENIARRTGAPIQQPTSPITGSSATNLRPAYPPQTRFIPSGPASPPPYYSPTHSGMSSPRPHSPDYRNGCLAHVRMTAMAKCSRYFRRYPRNRGICERQLILFINYRLINYRHMDFEFACWQMIYLLVTPQKV